MQKDEHRVAAVAGGRWLPMSWQEELELQIAAGVLDELAAFAQKDRVTWTGTVD